ncbi:hypothetical protein VKS41_008898 [Umbelopsis sp. WA50703]
MEVYTSLAFEVIVSRDKNHHEECLYDAWRHVRNQLTSQAPIHYAGNNDKNNQYSSTEKNHIFARADFANCQRNPGAQ